MKRTRAQESRAAIEKLYITMRHLFTPGHLQTYGCIGRISDQLLAGSQP